ncbi:hypothetical protein [Nocardiopsis ansamitocini]|uniref:DUF3558 domain-containing protein n=1 Tax=Nocardiopsis ansamitocini TaxID=1670832 RepID=A0A9W6P8N7_9ACTN|nr:hypothetical protein [Nocardiopsis ansamitocini]GLU49630.1 hypothetical protein Nans01_39810 [Nocardiopsis ansamitocini]
MRSHPPSPAARCALAAGAFMVAGSLLTGCSTMPFDLDFFDGASAEPSGEAAAPSTEPSAEEAPYAVPESCADVGATELVGSLVPENTTVEEEAGEVSGADEARQLSCVWSGGQAADPSGAAEEEPGDEAAVTRVESIALVFTINVDPSDRAEVVQAAGGEEEMNWEVDVDVDVDTYRTDDTDTLGGELKSVSTVDGSNRQLHLSLPGEFHVSVIAVSSDATQEDMERILVQAVEQARR